MTFKTATGEPGVKAFADTLCRRMCPRCADGHAPTLDRGVYSHVITAVARVNGSLLKRGEPGYCVVTSESVCRAGEVRQLLAEMEEASSVV